MPAPPHTYLVTGASRGIGLEFVRELCARGDRAIATAREPAAAGALRSVAEPAGARIIELDVASPESLRGLAGRVGPEPIDVLINNAGVASTSKSVGGLDVDELDRVFRTNTLGPL